MVKRLSEEEWERAKGSPCPSCGELTVRFVGRVCPKCARALPGELAEKLNKIGLPTVIDDTTVTAALFDHQIQLSFARDQGIIYYQPGRQAERRLFHHLEQDLKGWAKEKGLSFATKEEVS